MSGFMPLLLAFVTGAGLGLFYFGGLWLTVQRLADSHRPVLLFAASFAVRTALTVLGFYFVMDGRWERALACLLGFIIVRQLLVSRLRPTSEPTVRQKREGVHP